MVTLSFLGKFDPRSPTLASDLPKAEGHVPLTFGPGDNYVVKRSPKAQLIKAQSILTLKHIAPFCV